MNVITKTVALPDGRTISIETGKLAKQADGSVVVRMGNTMLLATVCCAKDAVPGTDFMPLTVEYKEKFGAYGRFPGGFTKREGKASDYEILTARLIDRALRPLFPDDFHAETFVNVLMISADGVDQPDALAGLAAPTHYAHRVKAFILFRKLQIIIIPKKPEISETHEKFSYFFVFFSCVFGINTTHKRFCPKDQYYCIPKTTDYYNSEKARNKRNPRKIFVYFHLFFVRFRN